MHIIRFKGTEIDNVISQVNSTGFGLTMGIHTRIEARAEYLSNNHAPVIFILTAI